MKGKDRGRRIGWDPWAALREREHIVFGLRKLPRATGGGVYVPRGRRAALIIDPRLSQVRRLDAVAHELVHDELGGSCVRHGMPEQWQVVADREERRVRDEAVRRLVPLDVLAGHRAVAEANYLSVTPAEIADWFDVSIETARRAMELLEVS